MMVQVYSMQFGAAVHYLWTDNFTKKYRVDAVNMGYAALVENILLLNGAIPSAGEVEISILYIQVTST